MKPAPRYLQFPLFILQGFFDDRKAAINNIFAFGIYHYSKKFKYSEYDVARQIIYDLYNRKLSDRIKKRIKAKNSDLIGSDDFGRGFNGVGNRFDPQEEIEELLRIFQVDPTLEEMAITHYQIHLALAALRINGNIERYAIIGKQIEDKIPLKEPLPMVNVDSLFDFHDNDKTEFEIAQFLCFIAIKSILGEKKYCKTNKDLILSRMFGYSSYSKMGKPQPELHMKYKNRYHIDRVLMELRARWNVVIYAYRMRGFYVAIDNKITIEKLVEIAEGLKTQNLISELKNREAEARKKVQQRCK